MSNSGETSPKFRITTQEVLTINLWLSSSSNLNKPDQSPSSSLVGTYDVREETKKMETKTSKKTKDQSFLEKKPWLRLYKDIFISFALKKKEREESKTHLNKIDVVSFA